MKLILTGILFVFLASCTQVGDIGWKLNRELETEQMRLIEEIELPQLGAAPELINDIWLNTKKPLRISELAGNVILLEMWTFG